MKRIFIIHPEDTSTSFLSRIKNSLILQNSEYVQHFNVKTNDQSRAKCLEIIENLPENVLIIFLGHGKSDCLYGSKGKNYDNIDTVSKEAVAENPSLYYYDDSFITKENINVLKNKKIFCLACNSNGPIGNLAIENGAKTFLGFGDIPTSISEFQEKYQMVSHDLVRYMKTEINYIIKRSLLLGIHKNLTFEDLNNYIKFISNQRIAEILINNKKNIERYRLVDNLYLFKSEIKIFGDKKTCLY